MAFKLEVTRTYVHKATIEVEAASLEEAKIKAFSLINDTNLSIDYALDADTVDGDLLSDLVEGE